jgi:hypothetical protein
MFQPRLTTLLALAILMLWMAAALLAQNVTGQISGAVVDSTGSSVSGATVILTADLTHQTRTVKTGPTGEFIFTDLIPGAWSIHITMDGFKTYEQSAIQVSASERVALHQVALEVGAVTSTIEVTAQATRVQTDSSERSGLITTTQVENTPSLNRNFLSQLSLLPGVVDTSAATGGGAPVVNGGRDGQAVVTLDGIVATDNGVQNTAPTFTPNQDAIGEMRALLSNYQAEYGVRAGGTIQVAIKSGAQRFHGTAYYYGRNEFFNANDYFNNLNKVARNI